METSFFLTSHVCLLIFTGGAKEGKERGYNGNSGTRGYYKSSERDYYDDDHYWNYPETYVPGTYYPKTYYPTYYYPKTQPPKYYYPHSSKGKYYGKGKGKKSLKGQGKGGYNYHDYDDYFYPTVDDIPFFDDQFFDDAFFDDDDCELVSFNETFSFAGPTLFLAPDTDVSNPGTPSLPGTVFIFEESPIFELQTDDAEIEGTNINGVCTRTTIGEDGGGMCQLTFVDDEGYTINVSGYLQGPFGSQMAITGGTGSTTGIVGTMDFFPEFGDLDADAIGDIFLDTTRFDVIAEIGIIVCPSPY